MTDEVIMEHIRTQDMEKGDEEFFLDESMLNGRSSFQPTVDPTGFRPVVVQLKLTRTIADSITPILISTRARPALRASGYAISQCDTASRSRLDAGTPTCSGSGTALPVHRPTRGVPTRGSGAR